MESSRAVCRCEARWRSRELPNPVDLPVRSPRTGGVRWKIRLRRQNRHPSGRRGLPFSAACKCARKEAACRLDTDPSNSQEYRPFIGALKPPPHVASSTHQSFFLPALGRVFCVGCPPLTKPLRRVRVCFSRELWQKSLASPVVSVYDRHRIFSLYDVVLHVRTHPTAERPPN